MDRELRGSGREDIWQQKKRERNKDGGRRRENQLEACTMEKNIEVREIFYSSGSCTCTRNSKE